MALVKVWEGDVVLCLWVVCFWILCVDGRSRYLYNVLDVYLHILCEHSVQSYCTFIVIYFLTCICLWQISQIEIGVVVEPGLVSISPAFMRSSDSASQPVDPHDRLA